MVPISEAPERVLKAAVNYENGEYEPEGRITVEENDGAILVEWYDVEGLNTVLTDENGTKHNKSSSKREETEGKSEDFKEELKNRK
jgi:hypothetical protein